MKSNLDSGIPQAIQYAAIEALNGPQNCIKEHNDIYQRRRDLIVDTLNKWDWKPNHRKPVFIFGQKCRTASLRWNSPMIYWIKWRGGDAGHRVRQQREGYVRLSLTIADALLLKGLSRMVQWHDSKNIMRPKKV